MTTEADETPAAYAAELARAVPEGCAIHVMGITPTWAQAGTVWAQMVVGPHHLNQVGVVQGGVYGLFADATAGWAAMSALPDHKTFVTLDMRVNLLRAARPGTRLIAEASPIHLGGTTLVFDVRLRDENSSPDRLVAHFVCTQLVLDVR